MGFRQIFIFAAFSISVCYSSCIQEGPTCAKLFEKDGIKGRSFNVPCGGYIHDLGSYCEETNSAWDITQSLVVETGCSVNLCSESGLRGTCKQLTGPSTHNVLPSPLTNVMSVNCTCSKECQGAIPTSGSCHAVLQALHDDILRREAKYHELVKKVMSKEGENRTTACNDAKQAYRALSQCTRNNQKPFRLVGKPSNRCVDVQNYGLAEGTSAVLHDCSWADNQVYTQVYPDATGSWFQLRVEHTGMCLGATDTDELVQKPCSNDPNQLFRRAQPTDNNGHLYVQKATGKCISTPYATVGNNTKLILQPCESTSSAPRFRWEMQYKP